MHPQHFWSDLTETRIQINPKCNPRITFGSGNQSSSGRPVHNQFTTTNATALGMHSVNKWSV